MSEPSWQQGLAELALARTAADLDRTLESYPELCDPALEAMLTNVIRAAWAQQTDRDRDVVCRFLAYRTFLRRYREGGRQVAIAGVRCLPLALDSPLAQLFALSSAPADLPRRAELARQVLTELRRDGEPDLWVALQLELADCLAQDTSKDRAARIEEALAAYTAALAIWSAAPYAGSLKHAQALHGMGVALRHRVHPDRRANLRQALDLYNQALAIRMPSRRLADISATLHDLGIVWMELPDGDWAVNARNGIACFEMALKARPRAQQPELWATTAHELAIALCERPDGDRVANIDEAIKLLDQVLEVRTPAANALDWARSKVALGNAYVLYQSEGRAENLRNAIECYQEALQELTLDAFPADWARAQYNLAIAYRREPSISRAESQQHTIACLKASLSVYRRKAYPFEQGNVMTVLGNIYRESELGQRADNLEKAIRFYKRALDVRTPESDPAGWATVTSNLANAYADRIAGDKAQNQELAIGYYWHALEVRTLAAAPERRAETLNNLGTVYIERLHGDPADNRALAIDSLNEALAIYNPDVFPHETRRAARNLGHLLFEQRRWAEAADAYEKAIAATVRLYRSTVIETGRQAELNEAQDLFACRAYALAQAGDAASLGAAVECLESGRARALAEGLELRRLAFDLSDEQTRQGWETTTRNIRQLETKARILLQSQDENGMRESSARSFRSVAAELAQERSRLLGQISPMSLAEIARAATLDHALAYLITTLHGSLALVVIPSSAGAPVVEAAWADLTRAELAALLIQREGADIAGFLPGQLGHSDLLKAALAKGLPTLGEKLICPLANLLRRHRASGVAIIPGGHLGLLPLHAARYMYKGQAKTFLEEFSITYAPGAGALRSVQERLSAHSGELCLVGVGNPLPALPALPFAEDELHSIAALFPQSSARALYREQATRTELLDILPGATNLHFACHGTFNVEEPLESALYLAGGDRLQLRELLKHDFNGLEATRLAVLSACQTAITDMQRLPDEAIGLPAGFLQAGACAVVGTLWPVADDSSTALLMTRFYELMVAERRPPARALVEAQSWMHRLTVAELDAYLDRQEAIAEARDATGWHMPYTLILSLRNRTLSHDPPFADPFCWAPFTFSGAV